jgi:multiple sugar transport system permease protein
MSTAAARGSQPTSAAAAPSGQPDIPLNRRRRSEVWPALAFLSPWIVGFLVFTLWPVLYSGYLSLTDYDVINPPTFVGFANYEQLWNDPKIALSLKNTLFYTALAVPAHLIGALLLAMLLNQAGKATGFFRTAFFLPKMTPPVAVGVLLLLLLNGQSGLVNQVLGWFGVDGPSWTTDPTWVKPGLILMSMWTIGSTVIIILAALRDVPQELYDAAMVDGAGPWQRTWRITIPMISPTLFFVLIVNTIAAFQMFTEAYTAYFGSGNSTYSNDAALFYVVYLFRQGFEFLFMGYASAMAWVLFVIIMLVTLIQYYGSKKFVFYQGDQR